MYDLFAGLSCADPLTDVASVRQVVDAVATHVPAASPYRWGYFEPLTERWTDDTLAADTWLDEDVSWQPKKASVAEGFLNPVNRFAKTPRASVGLSADRSVVDPAALADWLRALAGPLRADHGFLHLPSTPDAVPAPRPYGAVSEDLTVYQSATTISQNGIAELLWGTILGPAYVALIGADTIRSAPAAAVEEVAPDTFWLQVTAAPTDPLTDWAAFDTARQAIKKHLGERLFWQRGDTSPRLVPDWAA